MFWTFPNRNADSIPRRISKYIAITKVHNHSSGQNSADHFNYCAKVFFTQQGHNINGPIGKKAATKKKKQEEFVVLTVEDVLEKKKEESPITRMGNVSFPVLHTCAVDKNFSNSICKMLVLLLAWWVNDVFT
jgi:hypothetical protein